MDVKKCDSCGALYNEGKVEVGSGAIGWCKEVDEEGYDTWTGKDLCPVCVKNALSMVGGASGAKGFARPAQPHDVKP
jgi:hypothetical protein